MSRWGGYDAWKLDYPAHWDEEPPSCKECGYELNDSEECENEDCECYPKKNEDCPECDSPDTARIGKDEFRCHDCGEEFDL